MKVTKQNLINSVWELTVLGSTMHQKLEELEKKVESQQKKIEELEKRVAQIEHDPGS